MTTTTSNSGGLRGGFRRISTALILYGMVGLVVAIIGLAGLVYVNTRIGAAADRAEASIAELTTTLDRTATALHDASASAQSFAVTISRTSSALDQAATTIANVQPQLGGISDQFRGINILGNQPLLRAADLVSQLGTDIDGLDQRLKVLSASLLDNRDSLLKNADSLEALGSQVDVLTARIRSGVIQESLADLQVVVTLLIAVFVMWAVVPAIGALIIGVWLRRELSGSATGAVNVVRGAAPSARPASPTCHGRHPRAVSMTSTDTTHPYRADTGRATATAGRSAAGCPGCRR